MNRPGGPAFLRGIAAGLVVGLVLAALLPGNPFGGDEGDASESALEAIEDSYWKAVDPEQLEDASVAGIVMELRRRYDDRFSHYFDPKSLEEFEAATSGEFSGVGLAVNEAPRGLRVARVYEDTPAKRAGIHQGDLIVAVDGESIAGKPPEVATAMIKGPPGTSVELAVVSQGEGRRELTLERASVRIPAVSGRLRRIGGHEIGFVELLNFSDGVHGELRSTVEGVYRKGAEGLVLDLRGNGGGLLNEAVLTSSVFVEDGKIVTTEGRTKPRRTYEAAGDALESRPMVVLIDRATASAAEILAAALSDHGLATLVGTRTFGKGTFQEVIELPNGGAIDLTVGEYLTADGTSLADRGIHPEVSARDDPDTKPDEGLERALEVIAGELER